MDSPSPFRDNLDDISPPTHTPTREPLTTNQPTLQMHTLTPPDMTRLNLNNPRTSLVSEDPTIEETTIPPPVTTIDPSPFITHLPRDELDTGGRTNNTDDLDREARWAEIEERYVALLDEAQ